MLAKSWKKIGIAILVIACLINIGVKMATKISFDDAITGVKASLNKQEKENQNK